MKSIALFYRNPAENSDKVYRAELVPSAGGFAVNFQYGKRGAKLSDGTKTRQPVALAEAESIFAKLVAEKTRGGYTEDANGQPFGGDAAKLAEVLPHPSKTIVTLAEARQWSHGDFLVQRKLDGELDKFTIAGADILCEFMKRKSGGFYTADDEAMFAKFPNGWRAALTVAAIHGENVLHKSNYERWNTLRHLSRDFPDDIIIVEQCDVPENLTTEEGYVAHSWDAPWGTMQAVKQATIYVCRVSSMGGTQSVGIADAATGAALGNVKLGGGKCDRVRVGSLIRVEGMGLTDKGLIRQPVCCREWLVKA